MKKVFSILLLMLLLACMLTSCGLTVPRPAIKKGEFHFTVTYEYGGETKTVSGVYVCEYNGMEWALDGGYYRDWTGYIQGGGADGDFVAIDTVDGDEIFLVLNLVPDYFMDDFIEGYHTVPVPYLSVTYWEEDVMTVESQADVIEENYGAKILHYEYAEPIENTFR